MNLTAIQPQPLSLDAQNLYSNVRMLSSLYSKTLSFFVNSIPELTYRDVAYSFFLSEHVIKLCANRSLSNEFSIVNEIALKLLRMKNSRSPQEAVQTMSEFLKSVKDFENQIVQKQKSALNQFLKGIFIKYTG